MANHRKAAVLVVLVALSVAGPTAAATIASGRLALEERGARLVGTLTFDAIDYTAFGKRVNLGLSVGTMSVETVQTSFDPLTGSGGFDSTLTSAPLGCFARGVPGCDDCPCETCVCGLDASCCDGGGEWSFTCAGLCTGSCGQECPPLALSFNTDLATYDCRDASGVHPTSCTAVGDLTFFQAALPGFYGDVSATLPQAIFTTNGALTVTAPILGSRAFEGQFTISAFRQVSGCCTGTCAGGCDDGDPSTMDACHPLRGCVHSVDSDGDGIFDDGDGSGLIGDAPCAPGQTTACDDTCPDAPNTGQEDFDLDGVGDACDDADGDALLDEWEIRGLPGVALDAMGANPLRKDVFIEADWMEGYSCQIRRCRGGAHHGELCPTGAECGTGAQCVGCTCPEDACLGGAACDDAQDVCRGDDQRNGDDCSCAGGVAECADPACGPDGRCVLHSHDPKRVVCPPGGGPCVSMIDIVAGAFANAPLRNPDGSTGITLHVDAGGLLGGSAIPHQENMSFGGGSPQSFYQAKACHFDFARAPAFHYTIFAHDWDECASYGGVSDSFQTNDFIITTGSWIDESGRPGGRVDALADIFFHELGHNLGLHHGGADDVNYKPNYVSSMNYLYPLKAKPRLDYSRAVLPQPSGVLDELALVEVDGLPGFPLDLAIGFSCPTRGCPTDPGSSCACPGDQTCAVAACEDPPLNPDGYCGCLGSLWAGSPDFPAADWNCSGTIDADPVVADLNRGDLNPFAFFGVCPVQRPPGNLAPDHSKLRGYNDWSNLRLDFRAGPNYDESAEPGTLCSFLDWEQYLAVPEPVLPPELCDGRDNDGNGQIDEGYDADGDGVVDCFDNCPTTANAEQSDGDLDGAGDACDPLPLPVAMQIVEVKQLKVGFGRTARRDKLTIRATVVLGAASDGLFPPNEPLTISLADTIGDVFRQTLPPGSIAAKGAGFTFRAPRGRDGVDRVVIKPRKASRPTFVLVLSARDVDLSRLQTTQLTLHLTAGNDFGAQTLPCSTNRHATALSCRG
jgi:hypothetical protein